ncbi:MAG: circadian clock KaiB family protein [Alphaproteobacteria bacterium]
MTKDSDSGEDFGNFRLRLFVSGATPRSMRAIAAVRRLCEARLAGRYSLDVIDIYRDPEAARRNQIVAVPTLMRDSPVPRRLFVGDMTDTAPLAAGLGLAVAVPAG